MRSSVILLSTGQVVQFDDATYFNFRDLTFQHQTRARVAVLIATMNGSDHLSACIRRLERTLDPSLAEIIIIDHQPTDADSLKEFAS